MITLLSFHAIKQTIHWCGEVVLTAKCCNDSARVILLAFALNLYQNCQYPSLEIINEECNLRIISIPPTLLFFLWIRKKTWDAAFVQWQVAHSGSWQDPSGVKCIYTDKFLMNSLNGTRELMKDPNVHSTAVWCHLHTLLVLAILDPTILFELNFCIMNAVP